MARRAGPRAGQVHVPGVWSAVLVAERDRQAGSVDRYLGDPRDVLALDVADYARLEERAQAEADGWLRAVTAAGEPVTVTAAVLRGLVPGEFLRRNRGVVAFAVCPDDTITTAAATTSGLREQF